MSHRRRLTTAKRVCRLMASAMLAAGLFAPAAVKAQGSWTGFYVGANGGYQWGAGNGSLSLLPDLATWTAIDPDYARFQGEYGDSPSGFLGGAQLGYNWQSGTVVLGTEVDFAWSDADATSQRTSPFPATARLTQDLDWFGTLRARIGVLPSPNLLVYLTGGLAYAHLQTSHFFVRTDVVPNVGFAGSSSSTEFGGTIGGGVEWAIASGWTVKAEYLYYDLGERTVRGANFNNPGAPAGFGADAQYDMQGHIVRVGLNYKVSGF